MKASQKEREIMSHGFSCFLHHFHMRKVNDVWFIKNLEQSVCENIIVLRDESAANSVAYVSFFNTKSSIRIFFIFLLMTDIKF